MKKIAFNYFLDIIVIILGISISFYLEKQSALAYKEELKNQSLNRVLKNINIDHDDFIFNKTTHEKALNSISWIYKNKDSLKKFSLDSIGYHLSMAIYCNTVFVDNQEEYRGIQNSGLIELIENEKVVEMLQNKYIRHEFIKKIEGFLNDKVVLDDYFIRNTTYSPELEVFKGFVKPSTMNHKNIEHHIIQKLLQKRSLHEFYLYNVDYQIGKDSSIVKEIKKEIN